MVRKDFKERISAFLTSGGLSLERGFEIRGPMDFSFNPKIDGKKVYFTNEQDALSYADIVGTCFGSGYKRRLLHKMPLEVRRVN